MRNDRDRALDRLTSWREDTYAMRLSRLKQRSRDVLATGAALTAFVVAVAAGAAAAGIYNDVPGWLRALIFTFVIIAGSGLAFAWMRFQEESERIAQAIEHREDLATTPIGNRRPPRHADAFWIVGQVCTGLAPLAFLTAAWLAAL
jgi:MFS family permease